MISRPLYRNRTHAGTAVAGALAEFAHRRGGRDDVLVVALPRGGVIVARVVADALNAPLDILGVRKIGVPGMAEVALGAIVEGSDEIALGDVASYLGLPSGVVARLEARERCELERRVQRYRRGRPPMDVRGRTVVIVDDGLASGATMQAAVRALRRRGAARLMVACPVGSSDSCNDVASLADKLVLLATPEPFGMVSDWYDDFAPVSDNEVLRALDPQHAAIGMSETASDEGDERTVKIALPPDVSLDGDLGTPNEWLAPGSSARGLVIFAHGGGSSRRSYRNRVLAGLVRMAGWATLRVDLLVPAEQERDLTSGLHRFDVALIGQRLTGAIDWAVRENVAGASNIVLFGASTGAAAAVLAAAARPTLVSGVMSRGGRVDLAGDSLNAVNVPVLLLVGGADAETLRANRSAIRRLRGDVTIKIIRRAGHTFEESGALGALSVHALRWLTRHEAVGAPKRSLSKRFVSAIMSYVSARLVAVR